MSASDYTSVVEAARAACDNAQRVRAHHRRRTEKGSHQREQDIDIAMERVREAMKPIKSLIGRFPHHPAQTATAEEARERVREASLALQRERRKLWKMKNKNRRGGTL